MKSALSGHGIFSTCPTGQYTGITCHARRRRMKWSQCLPLFKTHLYQNVALASTTETIVESWSVTMKQNVTRISGPKNVQCVTL